MAAPSNYEQLILELINRARLDPQAEADRLGISLNKNLPAGTISPDSKQPLAHNSSLNDAATSHSNWMLNSNTFSHTGSGGSDPGDRMQAAGYQFTGSWTWGENIAWNGTTGTLNVLNAAQSAHDGLFDSAGHRENILNGNFKEVGLGASTGNFQGYNAFMLTENFAKSGTGSFITGVAYNDNNSDDFYSVGEGRAGLTISLAHNGSGIGSVGGWNSGGYALKTTQTGNIDVTFSGGGLASAVTVTIALASENAKVDLVGTNGIESSVTTTLGQNAADLKLLGLNDLAGTGNSTGNTIIGNAGDNELSAGNGNDTVQAGAGHDFIKMGSGNDTIDGGAGSDQISYFNSTAGIDIDLAAGTASGGYANGDTLTRLEKVTGSNNHGDALRGTGGSNTLRGKGGDDTFWDRGGDDILDGGAGQDVFNMGLGNDRIDGGTGIDHISYSASTAGITLDLAAGTVSGGHANGDTLLRLESATGSNSHSDSLKGTGGSNTLLGQGGHDTFWDRGGNDVLDGGAGHDVFNMGIGNDHVDGGTGSDHISYRSSSAGVTIDLAAGTASGGHAHRRKHP